MKLKITILFLYVLFIPLSGCQDDDGNNTCTVTYSSGTGNTLGTAPEDSTVYNSGSEVTIMDNTGNLIGPLVGGEHDGSGIKQRFLEWNTSPEGTGTSYSQGDTFNITKTVTLHAVYTTGTDVLRKVGPGGGWVFYDAGSTETWGRYLEAAKTDQSTTTKWYTNGSSIQITDQAIGDGYDNTTTIIDNLGTNYAAGKARACTDCNYSNWSLPSKSELETMYTVLNNQGTGDFADEYYWSSSTSSEYGAWARNFGTGESYGYPKNNNARVRAIRAF